MIKSENLEFRSDSGEKNEETFKSNSAEIIEFNEEFAFKNNKKSLLASIELKIKGDERRKPVKYFEKINTLISRIIIFFKEVIEQNFCKSI